MTRRRKILTTLVLAAVLAAGVGGVWIWRTHTDEYRVARLLDEARDEDPRGVSGWLIDLGISDRRPTRHMYLIQEDLLAIGPPAVPQLIEALADRNENVAVFAALLLGEIGDRRAAESLVEAMDSPRWPLQLEATHALGKLGDARSARALVTALASTYDFLPDVAAEALIQMGPSAVEPLIDALEHDAAYARRMAAKALGEIGDHRAFDPLIDILNDKDEAVRDAAAEALAKMGTPAIRQLVRVSARREDVSDRIGSVLQKLGRPAVGALTELLGDGDSTVRGAAAEALGQLGDRLAVEPLIAVLSDDEWYVRSRAAQALGRLGDDRAAGPLTGLLYDENGIVRAAVANALHDLGAGLDD